MITLAVLGFTNVRYAVGLPGYSFWQTFHFTAVRLRFSTTTNSTRMSATPATRSIDEDRASFPRVPWGSPKHWRDAGPGNPGWFKQLWFAGNHSDIGGSYPENKSRLSDIALQWMHCQEAQAVPEGMKIDPSMLRLYPDPLGPLHDERAAVSSASQKRRRVRRSPGRLFTRRFYNDLQLSECCNIMNTRNTALARCATSRTDSRSISGAF